ncbi:MAG: DUF4440 domain-containing protein [Acidobacteriaceae bacterium]
MAADEVIALELRLLEPEFRRDRASVAALLGDDFVEFGSSGHVFDKAQILDLVTNEASQRAAATDFAARFLAPDVCLVTYRSFRADEPPPTGGTVLRSSLWVRRDGRWQVVFHQGTQRSATP